MKWHKTVLLALSLFLGTATASARPLSISLHNSFAEVPQGMNSRHLAAEFGNYLNSTGKFSIALRGRALDNQNDEIALTVGGNAVAEITQADYTAQCFLTLDGRIMKFSAILYPVRKGNSGNNVLSAALRAFCDDPSLRQSTATELLEQAAVMLTSAPQTRFLKAVEFREMFLKEINKVKAEKLQMKAADWALRAIPPELANIIGNKDALPANIDSKRPAEWIKQGMNAEKAGNSQQAQECFRCALAQLKLNNFKSMEQFDPVSETKPVSAKDWKLSKWNLTFRWLPAGTATLPDGKKITIEKGFWISEQPVSRFLYQTFIAQSGKRKEIWQKEYVLNDKVKSPLNKDGVVMNPADNGKPMVWIKKAGADVFVDWLTQSELDDERSTLGMEYKLPSYEEWYYAAEKLKTFHSDLRSEWTRSVGETRCAIAVTRDEYGEKKNWAANRGFRVVLTQR